MQVILKGSLQQITQIVKNVCKGIKFHWWCLVTKS